MYRSLFLTSFALLSTLAAGCGSLADDTDNHEPLAVLQGELTNPDAVSITGAVRVAVIWNCGDIEGDMYRVSQEVQVQPVFPSRFRLELTDPPPAGCMIDPFAEDDDPPQPGDAPEVPGSGGGAGDIDEPAPSDPGSFGESEIPAAPSRPQAMAGSGALRVAIGTIAAYDDLNANGKLDLVSPGAADYVDRVLGANESLMLVYLEGNVAAWDELQDGNGNLPKLGYNLLDFSEPISTGVDSGDVLVMCQHPSVGTGGDSGGSPVDGGEPVDGTDEPVPMPEGPEDDAGPTMQWMDAGTFFVLTMTSDPQFASMMCKDAGGLSSESSGGTSVAPTIQVPEQYPSPQDPGLSCSADGLSYFYETCEDQGVCRGKICTGGCWYVPDPANPPAAWPCLIP